MKPAARWTAGVLLLLAAPAALPAAAKPTIQLKPGSRSVVEVRGLERAGLQELARRQMTPEGWRALLAVRVGTEPGTPPMLGTYSVDGDTLRFEARFPLQPGVTYRAVLDPSRLPGASGKGEPITADVGLPAPPPAPPTLVAEVYPTRKTLPENQLKFYLHFSAPMSRAQAYRHIRLLDEAARPIADPFLELQEELWDRSSQRFTLLIDPGRIKRGLKPREEAGPVLEEGKSYTLVIDAGWLDARGRPLAKGFRKAFRVGPPDEKQPDPRTWKLAAPAADSRAPLVVTSSEPLDHAMLHRAVWVVDAGGTPVEGAVKVTDEETRWHFTPARPWRAGSYRLVADTTLEDLAANSIARPFEVDVFRKVEDRIEPETVSVPFAVR